MLLGPPAALLLPLVLVIGLRLARGAEPGRWLRALIVTSLGIALIGTAAGLFAGGAVNGPAGRLGRRVRPRARRPDRLGRSSCSATAASSRPFRIAIIAIAAASASRSA